MQNIQVSKDLDVLCCALFHFKRYGIGFYAVAVFIGHDAVYLSAVSGRAHCNRVRVSRKA